MFEKLMKRFVADLIPKILPDLLREIAASIEAGNGYTITPESVSMIVEGRKEAVSASMAIASQGPLIDDDHPILVEWRARHASIQ